MKTRGINKGDRLRASTGAHRSGSGDPRWRDNRRDRLTQYAYGR
jgi:hypothetical protein